ncbi:MAG TPA: DUF4397 domain-containing protein [Clostridia bacterium]|nr:DUF4397 domain-containing protein [Clostridia bacterium]
MFGSPCCPYNRQYSRIAKSPFIRLLHASPNTPTVDVYANDNLVARNLSYKEFTEYFPVPASSYRISAFPTGQKSNPVLSTNISVPAGSILTVAGVGVAPNLSILSVADRLMPIPPGKTYIRFVHLSPNAQSVDVTLPNGTKLFSDVEFKEVTNYIAVNPGQYTLQARAAGMNQVILNVPNINIKPRRFYTIYAVGLAGENPTLQMLIALDGNSYISAAR